MIEQLEEEEDVRRGPRRRRTGGFGGDGSFDGTPTPPTVGALAT
jgi:hypothetical protein